MGVLIAFLAFYFNFFILKVFAIIISGFYILNIIEFQYKNDPIIKNITAENEKKGIALARKLIIIKLLVFWITVFITGILVPYK